jgi:hypothetical protein
MEKLFFLILSIAINLQSNAQGWIAISDSNSLITVNSALSQHSIKVGIGTYSPTAQFHTNGSVRLEGLEDDSTLHNFVVINENGNLYKRKIPNFQTIASQVEIIDGKILEQNAKIKLLEAQIAELKQMILEQNNKIEKSKLLQNIPNPYNQVTEIEYEIEETSKNARVFIYNLQGEQLKEISINKFGKGKITLEANNLNSGMYLYSLVIDGKIVDTKRMILTK